MALNGHVLAAAKTTAARYQRNSYLVFIQRKQRGDLFLVNVNTLPLTVKMNAILGWKCNSRLGFQEGMLDTLGLIDPGGMIYNLSVDPLDRDFSSYHTVFQQI